MKTIEQTQQADAAPETAGIADDLRAAASAARAAAMWADGLAAPGRRHQQVNVAQEHVARSISRAQAAFPEVAASAGGTDGERATARAISTLYAATETLRTSTFVPASPLPGRGSRSRQAVQVDPYAVETAVAYLRAAAADLDQVAHLAAFEAASLDDLLGGLLAIPV